EKGQLLLRLDDRVSGADASYSNLTVEQLLAQRARLEAEPVGAGRILFPVELTHRHIWGAHMLTSDGRNTGGGSRAVNASPS
ncbi:MAG: hypothetical protein ABI395_09415, partial [Sphingobium sp.]